jgi:hypothetical protein
LLVKGIHTLLCPCFLYCTEWHPTPAEPEPEPTPCGKTTKFRDLGTFSVVEEKDLLAQIAYAI